MVELTKRQKNAIEKSNRILEAGIKLLDERGYDAVTISDIVEAADVSLGTFYHYFHSKDDLFFRHSQVDSIKLDKKLNNLIDGDSFSERFRKYLKGYFLIMSNNSVNFLSYWLGHTGANQGGLREYYMDADTAVDVGSQHMAAISEYLQSGVVNGNLAKDAPVDVLAQTIYSSMIGMMVIKCITNDGVDLEKWADEFHQVVFDLLLHPYLIG